MMATFYNVLKKQIKRKAKTKEEYQEMIALWLYAEFLTTEEVADLLAYLDEIFPD